MCSKLNLVGSKQDWPMLWQEPVHIDVLLQFPVLFENTEVSITNVFARAAQKERRCTFGTVLSSEMRLHVGEL